MFILYFFAYLFYTESISMKILSVKQQWNMHEKGRACLIAGFIYLVIMIASASLHFVLTKEKKHIEQDAMLESESELTLTY